MRLCYCKPENISIFKFDKWNKLHLDKYWQIHSGGIGANISWFTVQYKKNNPIVEKMTTKVFAQNILSELIYPDPDLYRIPARKHACTYIWNALSFRKQVHALIFEHKKY